MIAPIHPALFGAPFPLGHPWGSAVGRRGWDVAAPRAHLLRDGGGCTLCRRGLPRCKGILLRVTSSFMRASCARCIKLAMWADGRHDVVASLVSGRGAAGERSATRLARAIGWWRMCGADASAPPSWLGAFFVPTDLPLVFDSPSIGGAP